MHISWKLVPYKESCLSNYTLNLSNSWQNIGVIFTPKHWFDKAALSSTMRFSWKPKSCIKINVLKCLTLCIYTVKFVLIYNFKWHQYLMEAHWDWMPFHLTTKVGINGADLFESLKLCHNKHHIRPTESFKSRSLFTKRTDVLTQDPVKTWSLDIWI